MWKDDPGVYQIKCMVNKKIYIGSSMQIKDRWRCHKQKLRKGIHPNKYLQYDWNKFGEENFKFEVLKRCEVGQQYGYEQIYLQKYEPFADNNKGYNIAHCVGMAKYQLKNIDKEKD